MEPVHHLGLVLLTDRREHDAIDGKLLEVGQSHLPGQHNDGVVEGQPTVVEEARVVRADGYLDALVQHESYWVGA